MYSLYQTCITIDKYSVSPETGDMVSIALTMRDTSTINKHRNHFEH